MFKIILEVANTNVHVCLLLQIKDLLVKAKFDTMCQWIEPFVMNVYL